MNLCSICEEREKSQSAVCVAGHNVCQQCYDQMDHCPYCRCLYILTAGCQHNGDHSHELPTLSKEHFYRAEELMMLDSISNGSRMICRDLDHDLFEISDVHKYYLREVILCMKSSNILTDALPHGVKIYLSYLLPADRDQWLTKLGDCCSRLIIKLYDDNQYSCDLCICVGDEYVAWLLFETMCTFMNQKGVDPNISDFRYVFYRRGCADFFLLRNLSLLAMGRDELLKFIKPMKVCNIFPCDWFLPFQSKFQLKHYENSRKKI
jgi:hypothetical protein